MTRRNTAIPAKRCTFCYLSGLFLIVLTVCITCFIAFNPENVKSDKSIAKLIPKVYSKLEHVEPEDRDVFQFHGFKTSFLPPEETVMARKNSDGASRLTWKESEERESEARMKRSHRPYEYLDDNSKNSNAENDKKSDNGDEDYNEDVEEVENDTEDVSSETDTTGRESMDSEQIIDGFVHPKIKVDRGPLDDVVQQGLGQPELEEGEIGSSHLLYHQAKSPLQSFWDAQGNREKIRRTQANIMKQYIDENADPCEDFYQHACGNWVAHNPIPADKAGYDTFEMLREYLDTVLKDLLENHKEIPSVYPGEHLDRHEKALQEVIIVYNKDKALTTFYSEEDSQELRDSNTREADAVETNNNSEIINRIKRYLDKKERELNNPKINPISKIKRKLSDFIAKQAQKMKRIKTHYKKKPIFKRSLAKTPNKPQRNMRNHLYATKKRTKRAVNKEMIPTIGIIKQFMKKEDITFNNADAVSKARFFYKSCMNYDILHKRGHQPLLDLLKIFGGWPILDPKWEDCDFDWLEMMAKLRLYNNDILISEWVGPDIKNSEKNVIQFDQTSLGLPSRDYFLNAVNKEYLDAYKDYLIKIALLLGGEQEHVKQSAEDVIDFEIRLANITSSTEDRRNVSDLYQRLTIRKLETLVPQIKWQKYLNIVMNRTVESNETVVMFGLTYTKNLVSLIAATSPRTLANYLLWRFVRHRVNNLDDRFQSAKQQFYYILFGREQAPPRWKTCVSQANSNMGMALGSLFVRKYFDENSKNDTMEMTKAIRKAFRDLLHQTDWIDDETKTLAASKLDSMTLKIGYPDYILDKANLDERYKDVSIHPDKYFENILTILRYMTSLEQSSLSQPVDKSLWHSAPAVVNAYYSRNRNQILFPAGILQPPFFHRHFPKSLNFGGIGVVIGHEITHGFDDKGRLFDRDGNLHRWWTDAAVQNFHRRAQCLIDQYNQYVVKPVNVKLDGANTQGENIADNGGVQQAFLAYQRWVERHGAAAETLPGLNYTHTQLFFLNFAQVWCGAMRPEAMRNKLKTAVHSPGRYRVIGSLSNSQDFAREFNCHPGSPMNPVDKCTVW